VIFIAIPVHNEERTIGLLIWKVRQVMGGFRRDYEVIVLDDGSTDGTQATLERYRRRLPLRILRSDTHKGYAGTVEKLLREAVDRSEYPKRDIVITLQGDFTEDPAHLVDMVKRIEGGADLVGGKTIVDKELVPFPVRFVRGAARLLLGRTARKAPVSDPLSSFRAYRVVVLKKALREVPEGRTLLTAEGWGANLELLVKTAPHARRIEESAYSMKVFERPRESRFSPMPYLKTVLPMRGAKWPPPPAPPSARAANPPEESPSEKAMVP
jgi:glycosyltransferase involved in cell wall biosynthesis